MIGIAAGMALSVAMLSVMSAFDKTLELNFSVIDRSDVTVSFIEPLSDKTIYRAAAHAGRDRGRTLPQRAGAAAQRARQTYRGGINGLVAEPRLNRAVDDDMEAIYVRDDGIILAEALADILADPARAKS